MVAVAALAAVLLGACGSESGSEPTGGESSPSAGESSTSSEPSSPKPSKSETVPANAPVCSEVWREGGHIPRVYPGCMEGKTFVEREGSPCSSGQRLLHYRNFYGVAGGTAQKATKPLKDDPGYDQAAVECVA